MIFSNVNIEVNTAAIEITVDNKKYDLHSFADFIGYEYSVSDRVFLMIWLIKLDAKNSIKLVMKFENVKDLEISGRDQEMPYSEDMTLDELYYSSGKDYIEFNFLGGINMNIMADKLGAQVYKCETAS